MQLYKQHFSGIPEDEDDDEDESEYQGSHVKRSVGICQLVQAIVFCFLETCLIRFWYCCRELSLAGWVEEQDSPALAG